jgi:uncharacterized protein YrzB (UPF0473 family)
MDNRVVKVTNANGQEFDAEILDIFNVVGYDKDYCLYTFGEQVDQDNEKVYVSILKEKENEEGYDFVGITDQKEWNDVQEAVNESINLEGEVNAR